MNSLPLYIHIPFCISKCAYCDFFSVPCSKKTVSCDECALEGDRCGVSHSGCDVPYIKTNAIRDRTFDVTPFVSDEYIDALLQEAAHIARVREVTSWKTVYVGGGTPSLLTPLQLQKLFYGLQKIVDYKKSDEVTIEVNPCDVTEELLSAFGDCGVTRISCGIQSLNDDVLLRVQRRSTRDDVLRALALFSKSWHGIVSCDMISGLPQEDTASFIAGLKTLVSYAPHHISLYALTLEADTPLARDVESEVISYDSERADALWISGRDFLLANGYAQYEISNFCRCKNECVHNLAYWNLDDYAGIGAGATSTFYDDGVRITNTTDIAAYSAFWKRFGKDCADADCHGHERVVERAVRLCENDVSDRTVDAIHDFATMLSVTERIDTKTESFEFFMMGLRRACGVCRERYEMRFGAFPQKAVSLFCAWQKEGRAVIEERSGTHWYALTQEGLLFLNDFLVSLL